MIEFATGSGFHPSGSTGSDWRHEDGRSLTVGYVFGEWTFTYKNQGTTTFHRYRPHQDIHALDRLARQIRGYR